MKNKVRDLFNSVLNNKASFIKKLAHKKTMILAGIIVCLAVFYSLGLGTTLIDLSSKIFLDGSSKYDRISDNNTMEDYKDQLIDEDPNGRGSRYAGRVWADKSVEANNAKGTFNLGLKEEDDGVTTNVGLNTDFLHIFSTLGSSQVVDRESTKPLDVVLLLDISSSMTRLTNSRMDTNDSLHKVLNEANTLIDQLMGNDPEHPVHPNNRVGVIVYGGGAQQLLALDHYTPSSSAEGIGQYMRVSDKKNKSNNKVYFPIIQSNVNEGSQVTTKLMIADSTYLQGALYKGMKMLADEETTTYRNTVTGKEEARIPVLITLTDGATNIVSTTKSSNSGNTSYEWWQPFDGDVISNAGTGTEYANPSANPFYADCNEGTGYYNNSDARNKRDNKLEKEPQMISSRNVSNLLLAGYYQKKIQAHYNTDMKNYSIGFNVNNLGEFANEQLLGTLDPKDYLDPDREIDFYYLENSSGIAKDQQFAKKNEINTYAQAQVKKTEELLNSYIAGSNPTARFPEQGNYIFVGSGNAEFTWKHPEDSEYDVKSLDDVNYIDKYYTATDGDIANIFDQIFDEMLGSTFNPIEGDNDSGVSDSLTYMDPIGKYMEVKDKGVTLADNKQYDLGLLLFGQMHGMVKTGIYDYNTNSKIQKQFGSFEMGWYYLDPETGQYVKNRENASWSNGDIYYLDGDTTRQYVSTLPENVDSAPEEQRNKVYTIYRFEKNITTGKTEDTAARAVLHDNPCYNSGEVQYALNEIRVWVEDSGDYTGGTGGSVIDNGYDSMIYVNIPSRALPIQTANIKLNVDGTVKEYSTNLSDKKQSTPFRLFYGIGVSDDIKTEDKLDIDLAKVSAEYIQSHTDADGNVYFLSNYYSGTNYDGYVTDSNDSRSRGDANFTFSPSADNRYYAFQRPLTLYELNENDYVDGVTVDYTATKVFKTSTGRNGLESFENSHKKVESVSSDKAYWIIIDYYLPENNETVHMAVKRRGSELGSYLGKDKTGEFLVWYNPATGDIRDFVNNVKPADGYYVATKVRGLRTGDMAQNVHTKQSNRTGSAGTYYLPTASTNSDSESIVVDGYLGNNGRLTVSDALLEVTKEVEPEPAVLPDGTGKEKFNYTLSFENGVHTGDFQAIKTFKNPYSGKWQLRLSTIDLLTDERGLLQTEDNQLATDENGNYIYVGGNTDEHVFHLYNAADNDIAGSEPRAGRTVYVKSLKGLTDSADGRVLYRTAIKDHPAGSMEFWVKDFYLVKPDQLEKFDGTTLDGLQHVENQFVVADIDSNRQMKVTPSSSATYAQPQKAQVYSKYATNTQYLTETLNFELDSSTGKYVAKFSLGHNEGLVINGLEKDYKYTVEEVLTGGQIQNGYRFARAYGDTESDLLIPEAAGTARFGNTVQNENEVHYVNRSLNALSIVKTLKGLDSRTDTNRDWHFTVELKRGTADRVGGEYYYVVTKNNTVTRTGNINFESTDGGYTYTADFAIKGGEKMTIYGILDGTEYNITEKEAGQIKGYTTTVKGNNNEGTLIRDAEVEFINNNPAEYDITLGKIVEGFAGDKEKTWNFDITLTAPEGEEIPTEYVCEGEACPTPKIQFNKQEDNTYKATVQLKHGEGITIKDLLEGTTYNIVEQEADLDDYTTSHSGMASGTFGTNVTNDQIVTFTNTKYSYHDLTVGKLVKGEDGDLNKVWTFNIFLTPATGITLDDSYEYEGGVIAGYEGKVTAPADGEITFTKVTGDRRGSYMGTVSVQHGQKVTIKGLPERTRYFVSEINSNRDGYTALIPQQTGSFDSAGASGEVIITNVNLSEHDLIIEKQVEGTDGDKTKDWHFTVKLTPDKTTGMDFPTEYPTTLNGADSTNITFTETPEGSGVYVGHVTLKHNDKVRIKGLPEGTKYEVTEDEADQEQYLTKHTDNTSGTLENATDTQHIIYRNIKLAKQTLTLSKEVLGGAGEYEKPWEFVIKLSREDDIELGTLDPETSKTTVTYPSEGTSNEGVEAPSIDNVTFEKQEDGSYVAKVELKHGQSLTIKDIPENTKYEISETDANTGRYVTYTNVETSGTITSSEGTGITFYNKQPALVDLSLSKIVAGQHGDKNKDWNFTIKFKADENVKFPTEFNYTGTKSGTLTVSKVSEQPDVYEGTVTLKHNDTITINGIPENTKYEIVEKEANEDEYITTVDGEKTGTLQENGTKVTFTNTNLANFDLTIKKNVKGNNVETNKEWDFEIILFSPSVKDLDSTYKYTKNGEDTEYDFNITKNGEGSYVGHIFIKGGESATIKGLPEGTRYIVNEVEADQNGYITTTSENTEGVMDKDGIVVEYNNWRFTRHMLSIEKQLKGNNVDPNREWTFEITLKVPEGMPFETMYPYVMNTKGEGYTVFNQRVDGTYYAVVKLKGGEKITIKDIPNGVEYDVKEVEANTEGYTTTATNEKGTLNDVEEQKVVFVNENNIDKTPKLIKTPSNPNTGDGIMKYIVLLLVSMCELVVVGYFTFKNTKKANSK